MKPDDRIQIGVVGKPHGVRGGFYLDGSVDSPALVAGLKVLVADREFTVASRGGTDARPIVSFVEVSDRDEINGLRGSVVTAARSDLTPLEEGEWFADDLVGLKVSTRSGKKLGTVTRMTNLPSVDVLEVDPVEGEMLFIPMIKDAIVSISPEDGTVIVDGEFLDLG